MHKQAASRLGWILGGLLSSVILIPVWVWVETNRSAPTAQRLEIEALPVRERSLAQDFAPTPRSAPTLELSSEPRPLSFTTPLVQREEPKQAQAPEPPAPPTLHFELVDGAGRPVANAPLAILCSVTEASHSLGFPDSPDGVQTRPVERLETDAQGRASLPLTGDDSPIEPRFAPYWVSVHVPGYVDRRRLLATTLAGERVQGLVASHAELAWLSDETLEVRVVDARDQITTDAPVSLRHTVKEGSENAPGSWDLMTPLRGNPPRRLWTVRDIGESLRRRQSRDGDQVSLLALVRLPWEASVEIQLPPAPRVTVLRLSPTGSVQLELIDPDANGDPIVGARWKRTSDIDWPVTWGEVDTIDGMVVRVSEIGVGWRLDLEVEFQSGRRVSFQVGGPEFPGHLASHSRTLPRPLVLHGRALRDSTHFVMGDTSVATLVVNGKSFTTRLQWLTPDGHFRARTDVYGQTGSAQLLGTLFAPSGSCQPKRVGYRSQIFELDARTVAHGGGGSLPLLELREHPHPSPYLSPPPSPVARD